MFLVTAVILFIFWLLMSGQFDAFHITLGVFSSLFVAFTTYRFTFQDPTRTLLSRFREGIRFMFYCCWLLKEVILANVQVLKLALHPRLDEVLDPQIVKFKVDLKDDFPKFIFANSITLTPGTITIIVEENEFVVHAITKSMADGLPGEMLERVKKVVNLHGKL